MRPKQLVLAIRNGKKENISYWFSFGICAAPGPGLPAVGSAPITSVVGTPRLIQFSLKYSF